MADNVGLTYAFEAAFGGKEPSEEELRKFYTGYARLWCSVQTPENRALRLKVDPHAPDKARVNEQVVHQNGFYKAYQCREGDKMYLAENRRLHFWSLPLSLSKPLGAKH